MNQTEAQAALNVSRETLGRLEDFIALLAAENERHNLVSRSSLDAIWSRHILDSAQLVRFAPKDTKRWLDLGTGAGFPGLLIPVFHSTLVTLIESRRLRAAFLERAAEALGIEQRVEILCARVETVQARTFDVISARALAPLDKLLRLGERFSTDETVWILPKGRNAKSELEAARSSWQGEFRVVPSLTDPEAGIIVGKGVRRKSRARR